MQPLSEEEVVEALRHIETKQRLLQSVHTVNASTDCEIEKRRVITVGTVFILVNNQAAGESSLVEALVTTSRALWHVRVPENHGSRAARGETAVGMEGLNQTLGKAYCTTGRCKGRAAQAPRRAEAERWSSTRSERTTEESTAGCFWDLRTGLPSSLWISEMSPMREGYSGSSTRNITRRYTDPMPHFAPP